MLDCCIQPMGQGLAPATLEERCVDVELRALMWAKNIFKLHNPPFFLGLYRVIHVVTPSHCCSLQPMLLCTSA